jgi:hypothetical protein
MVRRRLTLSAWQPANERIGFDRIAAAKAVKALPASDAVLDNEDGLTSVEVLKVGRDDKPTVFLVNALHDEANRPNEWAPGQPAKTIRLPRGAYTAFASHVLLWPNYVVGHDMWGNAPGLGRLARFLAHNADERVLFRPLYDPSLGDKLDDLKGWRGIDISIHDPKKRQKAKIKGLFGGVVTDEVPTINVTLGMGRSGPRDAYLPSDVADGILEVVDRAEEFFDGLTIRGHSKTEKTKAGNPKLIEINLLTHRLHEEDTVDADGDASNMPDTRAVIRALEKVRKKMTRDGRLREALEARIGPGNNGN